MVAVLRPDAEGLAGAVRVLGSGGVVGMPTETVYGLAADALAPAAVARVFAVKGRPADNPLIVHLAHPGDLGRIVTEVTPLAARLAARFWPGPLTLVLDARPEVPAITTGGLTTVAVRVPDHPVAIALLEAFDGPLAAPSANRSGRPSPTTAAHVVADLGADLEVVLDGGACLLGLESTVVDARGAVPVVLREGAVTREDLEAAFGGGGGAEGVGLGVGSAEGVGDAQGPGSVGDAQGPGSVGGAGGPASVAGAGGGPDTVGAEERSAASPGTRYRHYTPHCAVALVAPGRGPARARALASAGRRVGLVAVGPPPAGVVGIARFTDASALAQKLYAALRDAELAGVEVLVVESVPEEGVGRAVMDRLRRAAG